MVINGTITQAGQPSAPSGQYQVRYQDIVITDQQGGVWPGRIGSKQGYQANTPVSVTVETKEGDNGPYNYFRKYNPQYPDAQNRPRQTPPQQAPQNSNGEKEMRIVRGNALNAVMSAMNIMPYEMPFYLTAGVEWIMAGKTPVLRRQTEPDAPEPEEIPAAASGDDIPF